MSGRSERRGWYFYDWANSAFNTSVTTVFLGPYLSEIAAAAADAAGFVFPLGLRVRSGSFFPYVVSLSVLIQVVFLPLVGAVADRSSHKRRLLGLLAAVGSLATMALYFVVDERYLLGGALFVVANVAFGCSIVVYNSFLPQVTHGTDPDTVSARGWALGYAGGGLLLLGNLVLLQMAPSLGLTTGDAVRISLLSAGAWWGLFSLIPLRTLRSEPPTTTRVAGRNVVVIGWRQLSATAKEARLFPQTLRFLVAYLLYNDGIQTVIVLAAVYGAEELLMEQDTLVLAILLVQFIAIGGALLLGRLALSFGAKRVVLTSLVLWTVVVSIGYVLPSGNVAGFFALSAAIGLVLGGSQSLSRSLYARMIPPGREAEYFSFYEISERGTSWLGPLLFGLALQVTDSYRVAILSLIAFFVAGGVLLARVDVTRATAESGNRVAADP